MQYTDLLDNPDWFQSFNNTVTPVTTYTYGLRTTANSNNTRISRVFANDVPFGSGYCLTSNGGIYESEYILNNGQVNAYPKPTDAPYHSGSTVEFWVKLPVGWIGSDILKWKSVQYADFLNLGIDNTNRPYLSGKWFNTNGSLDSSTVTVTASQPITTDEWHLVTYVDSRVKKYINSTTIGYNLENIVYIDGIEVLRRTQYSNSWNSSSSWYQSEYQGSMPNGLEYGSTNTSEGMFSDYLPSGLKIANFAFWQNQAQSQKKIARRYMFGKTKKTVKQHTIDSNPYWYQTWDTFDSVNGFTNQYGSGPEWGILYDSTGMDLTVAGQERKGISTVGKSGLETLLFSNTYGQYIEALAATGNWSVDYWVKWDYTKLQLLTEFPANKPQSIWYSGSQGLASFLIRIDPALQINFGDRFNNGGMVIHPGTINNYYLYDKLTDGDWHHIAKTFSYSSGTLIIRGYLDGLKVAQGTYSVTTPNNPSNSWTGENFYPGWPYAPASTQKTNAYFDNYAIYNRTLTDTEIADKYRNFAAVDWAVKRYNGQTWEVTSTQKVWNGSDWILWDDASPTQWNGSAWVAI